jgi:16S rRNA A1518/A1519 N6-dimethyltransferase RsmA/KsgA/DIM1 with predicted DNA glycosylase/AP lyase activity
MIQMITFDQKQNTIMGNLPFEVPTSLIFDNLPQGIDPNDFQFDMQDIMGFFGRYFGMLT